MIPAGIGHVQVSPAKKFLSLDHLAILRHTEHVAAGGLYCGGGKDMEVLVAAGLMVSAGKKSFVPDEYYRITAAGRTVLREYGKAVQS